MSMTDMCLATVTTQTKCRRPIGWGHYIRTTTSVYMGRNVLDAAARLARNPKTAGLSICPRDEPEAVWKWSRACDPAA